jgi:hypothetical protein
MRRGHAGDPIVVCSAASRLSLAEGSLRAWWRVAEPESLAHEMQGVLRRVQEPNAVFSAATYSADRSHV